MSEIIELPIIGKLNDAKIVVQSRSTRGGLSGLIVTFETDENINGNTTVFVSYEKKNYPFEVREVILVNGRLKGICQEVGYWATKLGKINNLDLRTLINCEVKLVTDKKQLSLINEQSCWC